MIKAIIFDCFGVLVGDGFDATYRHAGGNPQEDQEFIEGLLEKANRAQISSEVFRQLICDRLGISLEEYAAVIKKEEHINHELLEYIKTLRPKYKTAILSNVNRGGLERRLNPQILAEHFDATVVSGDVGYIKPEAEIYRLTAERLGVRVEECVFVDDREPYTSAAEQFGMHAIVYKNFEQMKGELEQILASDTDN